ncbi:hypothetical protein LTS18_002551, partial [Coniosporium uncinatum]
MSTTTTAHLAHLTVPSTPDPLRLYYTDTKPPTASSPKGTILLLHGFPQTSHQFRHVLSPLAAAGYRVLAPDYRGAGRSSKPPGDAPVYRKSVMAADMH